MNIIIGILKIIFLLGFLVFIHEGGHFCVAKLCKIKVKEFSLGFGSKIYSKQGKETKYSIRTIPFGGYVDMQEKGESGNENNSFDTASIPKRMAIIVAGAIVNIVFGLIVYFILMAVAGVNSSTTIEKIIPEYASKQTVLQDGDKILAINGKKMRIKSDIDDVLYNSNGETINILFERNGENFEEKVTPILIENNGFTQYILGLQIQIAEKNVRNNIYFAFWKTVYFVKTIEKSMVMLLTGNVGLNQMAGPIGISEIVIETTGLYDFIYLLSSISISLGVTNLLPIPGLDGGKFVLLLIEAIRKKKLTEETEIKIQSLGFSFLILLSLYISFNDLSRIF